MPEGKKEQRGRTDKNKRANREYKGAKKQSRTEKSGVSKFYGGLSEVFGEQTGKASF